MEASSPFQHHQNDYALDILTHAAATARNLPGRGDSSTTMISNRRIEHRQNVNRAAAPSAPSDILTGYGPAVLSSRSSMEAAVYNQGLQPGTQGRYMMQGYQGSGAQVPNAYANDYLGILNAESYDDRRTGGGSNGVEVKQHVERTLPFGITAASRVRMEQRVDSEDHDSGGRRKKKPRIEALSGDEEDDAKKKSRGRPRVDTKDETAADRRRTQIRMAQRAYRHRKETTISSLEKQVQELKGTNEEMGNIFITLYDFAVGRGLLQREPEFGQQLQATTERFLALARASSNEDLSHDENQAEVPMRESPPRTPRDFGGKSTGQAPVALAAPQNTPPVSEPTQAWGGYTLATEDSSVEGMPHSYQQQSYENNSHQRHLQIITRPTGENASFPFDFTDLQTYRVEVPSVEEFSVNFYPQSQPPLPVTYNYSELSFARRLQRAALERAFLLASSPNPHEERYRAVFGFCMLYESREAIAGRIKTLMSRSAKESLQEWRAPFVHVGGAGTFYPLHDNNINGDLMPKFRTGYSMGPFSPSVTQIQDILDDDMRLHLPGFEGEFFDPNDVEGYLRGRGLDIPPAADYVTGVVDFMDLPEGNSPNNSDSTISMPSPQTPSSPVDKIIGNSIDGRANLGFDKFDTNFGNNSFSNSLDTNAPFFLPYNWDSEASTKEINSFLDPISNTIPTQQAKKRDTSTTTPSKGVRRTVTVNVNMLIDEILRKVVCLARSPGFRILDVNAALIAAVNAGPG